MITRMSFDVSRILGAVVDNAADVLDYCQERRDNFLYIALDLCQASLADLIERPESHKELFTALDRKKALGQVTAGVKHLHGLKIIHRDIKPQSVVQLTPRFSS
jgi:serine/threonine-protein kinase/endoribonuclease IRE1